MRQLLLKIINVAWSERNTPQDWSKGLITPVYKKGDKLDPSNYRAVTLLSIPGKVFCRLILNRIQVTIDNHLTEEQCGFRSSRGTTDAVFVVRQIIEKARERRITLHWNFVDFKAAFDTIWREALWKCLRSIGVNQAVADPGRDRIGRGPPPPFFRRFLFFWLILADFGPFSGAASRNLDSRPPPPFFTDPGSATAKC